MSRRFWRIYPAYVFAIALSLLLPGNSIWKTHYLGKSLLMHLLFVHTFNQTTIFELSPPFWTLAVEFQFYAAYPLLLMLRKRLGICPATFISLGLCAGLSFAFQRGWIGHSKLPWMPIIYLVQWCLGALIAERFSEGKPPLINLPTAVCMWITGILFAVPIATYGEWNYLAWAILFAAMIERCIRRKVSGLKPMTIAALVWLGTISYSIYLLHAIVLGQLLPHLPIASERRFAAALVTIVPIVVAASAISHYLIERPGIAIGRRWMSWWFTDYSAITPS